MPFFQRKKLWYTTNRSSRKEKLILLFFKAIQFRPYVLDNPEGICNFSLQQVLIEFQEMT